MSIHTLRPWTDLAKLHPDVEPGSLAEAVFAIDLGAIAVGDPSVPKVNEHIKNIYEETELAPGATIRKFRTVRREGHREVSRLIEHYNLDAILAVLSDVDAE
jgi:hypothetical protein